MKRMTKGQHPPNKLSEDLINNCETYLARMKNKKVDKSRFEQQNQRDISRNPALNQMNVLRPLAKKDVPVAKIDASHVPVTTHKLLHKEAFNNNMATVEVTVRTAPDVSVRAVPPREKSRSRNTEEKRETWSKLLTSRKSYESIPGSFAKFDPLRTLHFLSKELQLKLQMICPDDPSTQQIVSDMLHAMQRLPPDIFSQLQQNGAKQPSSVSEISHFVEQKERGKKVSTGIQVNMDDIITEKLHKKLEESASKLEANCKQMEIGCIKLRDERDELLTQLEIEKENVKTLRKMLDEQNSEKSQKTGEEIEKLNSDRNMLRAQVKQLQAQLKSQSNISTHELRTLIQQLRDKQLTAEHENKNVKNELALLKLEKEKLNVLLEYKDKELQELHSKLEGVQSLVSTTIFELKKSHLSPTSSISEIWDIPITQIANDSKLMQELLHKHETKFKDLQSISSEVSSIINDSGNDKQLMQAASTPNKFVRKERHAPGCMTFSTPIARDCEKSSSIKDALAEIKRHAFMNSDVVLSSPPDQTKNRSSP